MYQPMLFIHWKQIRLALLPFVVASFALTELSDPRYIEALSAF